MGLVIKKVLQQQAEISFSGNPFSVHVT